MTRGRTFLVALSATLFLAAAAAQSPQLTIVSTGPGGALDQLAQANEIRIVFSEPMVTLGRIPDPVVAPFVRITPAIPGTFRWSGTTILIFTPDPARKLPFATAYEVTVDTSATAVSGRALAAPVTFRFTTPTVRLLATDWYRRDGTVNSPMVVLLRFNQPVRPADVAAHTAAALQPHAWVPPPFTPEEQQRLQAQDPSALGAFRDKAEATRLVASGGTPVALRLTTDWDHERFPASDTLVAFETATDVKPESWVNVRLDGALPSPAGPATPGGAQAYTIRAEQAFFIDDFRCTEACDADRWNPIHLRAAVAADAFAAALEAVDVTTGDVPVAKAATPPGRSPFEADASTYLTLEDAGFDAQPPDHRYAVTAPAALTAADGQTLGYRWLGIVEQLAHARVQQFRRRPRRVGARRRTAAALLRAQPAERHRVGGRGSIRAQLMPRLLELQDANFQRQPPGGRRAPAAGGQARPRAVAGTRPVRRPARRRAPASSGRPCATATCRRGPAGSRPRTAGARRGRAGDEPRASPSRTARRTRSCSSRGSTPARRSRARWSRSSARDNTTFWRGTTGADGIAVAPDTPLRDLDDWSEVRVRRHGREGRRHRLRRQRLERGHLRPGTSAPASTCASAIRMLRGSRVHRPRRLPPRRGGAPQGDPARRTRRTACAAAARAPVFDRACAIAEGRDRRQAHDPDVAVEQRGVDADAARRRAPSAATRCRRCSRPTSRRPAPTCSTRRRVNGSFLVAAYRRPDFRVDISLAGGDAIAGGPLTGIVSARYLFGARDGAPPRRLDATRHRRRTAHRRPSRARSPPNRYGVRRRGSTIAARLTQRRPAPRDRDPRPPTANCR